MQPQPRRRRYVTGPVRPAAALPAGEGSAPAASCPRGCCGSRRQPSGAEAPRQGRERQQQRRAGSGAGNPFPTVTWGHEGCWTRLGDCKQHAQAIDLAQLPADEAITSTISQSQASARSPAATRGSSWAAISSSVTIGHVPSSEGGAGEGSGTRHHSYASPREPSPAPAVLPRAPSLHTQLQAELPGAVRRPATEPAAPVSAAPACPQTPDTSPAGPLLCSSASSQAEVCLAGRHWPGHGPAAPRPCPSPGAVGRGPGGPCPETRLFLPFTWVVLECCRASGCGREYRTTFPSEKATASKPSRLICGCCGTTRGHHPQDATLSPAWTGRA